MLRTFLSLALAVAFLAGPSTAFAGDKGEKGGKRHEKLLEMFDKDKDGKLSEAERREAKEWWKKNKGRRHKDGKGCDKDKKDHKKDDKGKTTT